MNRHTVRAAILAAVILTLAGAAPAQTQSSKAPGAASAAPAPAAHPQDVDTIDHIMTAIYDVISGPPGPRDWDRFRSLFYPGAWLIPAGRHHGAGITAQSITPDEYATKAGDYFLKEGFFENAVSNRVEIWDAIAHVWSTYESRHAKGEKPFARGINSFQLLNDGTRWWVVTIYWEDEDAAHPLPEKYLSGGTDLRSLQK